MKTRYIKMELAIGSGMVAEEIPQVGNRFFESKTGELIVLDHQQKVVKKIYPKGDWYKFRSALKPVKKQPTPQFMQEMTLSMELQAITKENPLTRVDVIKKLWSFIRKHGLQNPQNRRNIDVGKNELTKALFKKEQISMFEMTKLISQHMKHMPRKRK